MELQIVELAYFKPRGKYYSGGSLTVLQSLSMHEIFKHVKELLCDGKLPGLQGGAEYIVLVTAPGHPEEYPQLLFPEDWHVVKKL